MRPLTKTKLAYIQYRIDGECRKAAYHLASGNPNMKSCENLGSRMEIEDSRIPQLIAEGLREHQQIIEDQKLQLYRDQIARTEKLADLERLAEGLRKREEKLKNAPRDDSHLEIDGSGYPTREQCNMGTVKGHIRTSSPGRRTGPVQVIRAKTSWDPLAR